MPTLDEFTTSWIRSQRRITQQGAIAVAEAVEDFGKLQVSSSSSAATPATTPVADVVHDEFMSSLPAAFVQSVSDLRAKYAAVVNEYATQIANRQPVKDREGLYTQAADLLIAAYVLCQTSIGDLDLHALFLSPNIQTEVEAMLRLLFRDALISEAAEVLRARRQARPRSLGSRTLLTGVRGVGKTTILRAVQISVALLSNYMLPVYVNYEEEKKRSSVQRLSAYVIDCAEVAGFDTKRMRAAPDDIGVTMDSLRAQGAVLSALVDEFQVLYEEQHAVVGGVAAAEILSIARRHYENAIVSGSSHSVADLAFKRVTQPWNKDFVNLNNTVYIEERLHPLPKETFAHIAPLLGFKATSLDMLYSLTGGVGRDMDKALRKDVPRDPALWFKRFDEEYDKNGLFAHAIAYMQDHRVEEIDIGSLRAIYETMTGDKAGADTHIGMLMDAGILCPVFSNVSKVASYRLILPGAYEHIISRNSSRGGLSEKTILAFRSVLNYWEGAGSPDGFCETTVREWLCLKWPALGPHHLEYLHIDVPLVLRQSKLVSSTIVRAVTKLDQLDGLFGLSRETGIDGFKCETANGGTGGVASFNIHLLQIKLGAVGRAHITAGSEYTGSSANNSGQAKAMVGSACAGFNKLLGDLEKTEKSLPTAAASSSSSPSLPIAVAPSSSSSPSKLPRPVRATKKVLVPASLTHANYKINSVTFWLVTNKTLNAEARALFTNAASEAVTYIKVNCKVPIDTVELKLIAGDDFSLGVVPSSARDVIGLNGF